MAGRWALWYRWHRYRGLNPWSQKDATLLEAISRGEFTLAGLRNRDLRRLFYPQQGTDLLERRRAAAITRQLALLRAHGILRKVPPWLLVGGCLEIIWSIFGRTPSDST